jgi:pimeloyl-ACP methyl ester carboxylesterase
MELFRAVVGSGPAVVLTHGFGDSSETWSAQVEALAPRFAVHLWDLPGHGRSPRPDTSPAYTRDAAVEALERIVAEAGGAALVGHSLGGYLAQCLAIRRPDLVRALVLLNSGPGFRDRGGRARWNRGARLAVARFGLLPAVVGLVEQHDSFVINGLARIAAPVLAIAGGRDVSYHAALAYYARKLERVETVVIAGAGHNPQRTHPGTVNDAILEFLERRQE